MTAGRMCTARLCRGLFVGAALLSLALPARAAGTMNMMCAQSLEWCQALAVAFEKETGIKVGVGMKATGEVLAQIRAEKDNPRLDLWFSGTTDPFLVAAEEGLLDTYESPRMVDLHPYGRHLWEISKGRVVGVSLAVIGFGYNTELLRRKNLPVPKCWADLLDPRYKGEIQLSHPQSSGTAYKVIATLVQLMGEDKAFEYQRQLHGNVNSYARSGSAPSRAVAMGESALNVTFANGSMTEKVNGFPVEHADPCEGTGYEITGMSIVKGARNLEAARRFYDWYLTAPAMEIATTVKQFHVPLHKGARLDPRMPDLATIKLVPYDFATYGSSAVRQRLLDRWEREIGALPR